jgi:hypothetical protein
MLNRLIFEAREILNQGFKKRIHARCLKHKDLKYDLGFYCLSHENKQG